MIYLDTTKQYPSVYFPTHGWKYESVGLALTITNTVDGRELEVTITSSHVVGFLVCVSMQMPEGFCAGEWQYRLNGTGGLIATGLIMAYDGKSTPAVQYNGEHTTTIQYGGN